MKQRIAFDRCLMFATRTLECTSEGTPISGMPILLAQDAKHVLVCNFDKNPGYSGVPNPLYDNSKTTLLLGDAKDTTINLLSALQNIEP